MKKKHIKEMIRKTYGEVKQSKPAEVHNEPVETLEEIGLNASDLETAIATLTGILGLPAVAVIATKAEEKLKAMKAKGKEAVGLEEEYEATDHDIQIGPAMAGMVNIRKYLERSAPEHLNDLKAIDSVLTAYDNKMAYGDGDDLGVPGDNALGLEENIKKADAIIAESKMEKEFKEMYAEDAKSKERMRIANKLFPEIAKKQKGGKLVNFKPLSQKQRDEVYDNLNEETLPDGDTKITSDGQSLIKLLGKQTSILQKLKLINNRKELEDVLDYILTQVNPNLSLNQASVKAAAMSSIKKASATNESIITEADMIAESFRKVKI